MTLSNIENFKVFCSWNDKTHVNAIIHDQRTFNDLTIKRDAIFTVPLIICTYPKSNCCKISGLVIFTTDLEPNGGQMIKSLMRTLQNQFNI